MLCFSCWQNISGFNNFKHTVLLVQENFLKSIEDGCGVDQFSTIIPTGNFTTIHNAAQYEITEYDIKFPSDITTMTNNLKKEIAEINSAPTLGTDQMEISNIDFDISPSVEQDPQENEQHETSDENEERLNRGDSEYVCENSNDSGPSSDSTYKPRIKNIRNKSKTTRNTKSKAKYDAVIAQWKPMLECYTCSETFKTYTLLQKHVVQTHPDTDTYFTCCDKKFNYRCQLAQHARLHLNPNRHECPECKKCFNKKVNLNQHHFFVHLKMKPNDVQPTHMQPRLLTSYKCHFCPMAYRNLVQLRDHIKQTHKDEAISECPYCPKIYKQQTGVYHHVRRHHFNEYIKTHKYNTNTDA